MGNDTLIDEALAAAGPESVLAAVSRRAPEGSEVERARDAVWPLFTRYFFLSTSIVATVAALLFGWLPPDLAPWRRQLLVGTMALLGLAATLGALRRRGNAEPMIALVAVLAVAALVLAATLIGWGLSAPGLGFLALLMCMVRAATPTRLALPLAALMLFALFAIDQAPRVLPLLAAGPVPRETGPLRLLVHLMTLLGAFAGGAMIARVVQWHVRAADEREDHFRTLLAIAADAYWEIDEHYRLVAVTAQRGDGTPLSAERGLGKPPWELAQVSCDDDVLDLLQADLDTRVSFRNLPFRWQHSDGRTGHYVASGEPRFDERGVFRGYWGVVRDVTTETQARQALAATETRYQDLFTHIPTPLVLHRGGRVVDANAAGVDLFGYDSLTAMIGRDLLASYEGGDSRERARRRIEQLESMPAGSGLPVSDFRLTGRAGRRVSVRGTGVRVDTDDGPAVLSIYVDDTERRNSEEKLRRSEALLKHVVATSPDLISLSELDSGRYVTVNRAFERLTGYVETEVKQRTMVELGLWPDEAERTAFLGRVVSEGSVHDLPVTLVAKDGRRVQVRASGAHFRMDRREYLVINARDVTTAERLRVEREAILESVSVGIAVTRERHFVVANPTLEQMFRWPRGELVGQPAAAVFGDEAEYQRLYERLMPLLLRGEQVELERPMRRHDGSDFIARVVGKAIDPNGADAATASLLWVVQDVTERREFEQALARARDEAEAASRAKSAFLANTSHELRTPLHGMLGLAGLARSADIDETRRRQYLDQICETAQSLNGIISDILDLSKIEAGRLQVESTVFDLGELLRAACRAYATLAQARELVLAADIDASAEGLVVGDPLRVRQIVSNYLSNAVKFTPHGSVRLAARRPAEGRVRIEVHDSGQGIDRETQARLFKPFTQADESTTRRFGGTGLGLSICRELALLMGGEVGVDSGTGRGSVFWVELPLPPAPGPQAPASAPEAPLRALRGARALVAEDNAINMLIAVATLEGWGMRVEQATDGRAAVDAVVRAAADGRPFDIVLMDLQMPVMSGFEAARALRATEAGRELPIVALTAAALVGERERALADGMDDFLTKPIDADKLRATLARRVGRRTV